MQLATYLRQQIEQPKKYDSRLVTALKLPLIVLRLPFGHNLTVRERMKSVGSSVVVYGALCFTAVIVLAILTEVQTTNPLFYVWSFLIGPYSLAVVFGLLLTIAALPDWLLYRKIMRSYPGRTPATLFETVDYERAAEILPVFKSSAYESAIQSYPKKIVDLLILAKTVAPMNGKIKRIVSIHAIQEEREAGWDEE